MACRVQDKTISDVLELLAAEGFEEMADAMSISFNEAMRPDRSRHLGAGPWERVEARQGYANGYKPKQIQSRIGTLSEQEPHWREFLAGLKDRGLHGIEFFVSDAHEGLKAAQGWQPYSRTRLPVFGLS
jgi:transposase-like protein